MTAQFLAADRVKDTAASISGSTVSLSGSPPAGFQGFGAVGDGNSTVYVLTDGTNWEVSYGVYTASGTTLARSSVPVASSNSGSQVASFSGTITVFATDPAERLNAAFGAMPPGQYIANLGLAGGNTAAPAAGTVKYAPVLIPGWFSSVSLSFYLPSAGGATSAIAIGLYTVASGQPASLLVQQTGINVGSGGSAGINTTSSLSTGPRPPGLYFTGIVLSGSGVNIGYTAGAPSSLTQYLGISGPSATNPTTYSGWTQSSATLPSTPSGLSLDSNATPMIGLKVAL